MHYGELQHADKLSVKLLAIPAKDSDCKHVLLMIGLY